MKNSILFLFLILNVTFGFSQSKVKFKANIANRNGDMLFIKDKTNFTHKEIKADANGNFSATFVIKPDFYILFDGVEFTDIYLKNGFDLTLNMDAKNFDQSIVWSGKGAEENNFLAKTILLEIEDEANSGKINETNFQKYVDERKLFETERLNNDKLDPTFVALRKKKLEMSFAQTELFFKQKMELNRLKNSPSPSFDYENHKGGKTKLENFKGKYVYIDVWATWCGPCIAEIPSLKKLEEKFRGKNIEFVSISIDEMKNRSKWKKFVTEKDLTGTQILADKDWNSDFVRSFKINSIPRFILIDSKGNVLDADADRPSNPSLTAQLEQLLK